jgi:hypothetical protein
LARKSKKGEAEAYFPFSILIFHASVSSLSFVFQNGDWPRSLESSSNGKWKMENGSSFSSPLWFRLLDS